MRSFILRSQQFGLFFRLIISCPATINLIGGPQATPFGAVWLILGFIRSENLWHTVVSSEVLCLSLTYRYSGRGSSDGTNFNLLWFLNVDLYDLSQEW